jgi:hypothetical protein
MRISLFPVVTLACWVASFGIAQPPQDGSFNQSDTNQQGEDPPSRAARLSLLTGTVSFQPGGVEDWVPATPNRPLTTGDRLWTEAGSRAELLLGSAALRLSGRTDFTFINLNDQITQVQVSTGTLSVRLRRLADQESFEIDTPQVAFSLLRPGEYRIDVNEQGDATIVTVRGGQGEAVAGNQTQTVYARQQVRASGNGDVPVIFDERDAPVADAFDNFCSDRDRREDRSESARHVSRDMPGYADLDEHGVWREDPQYGWIWAPRVEAGWAPYHNGHWAWIAPWGWTWVDDAPWGYAPFHYGRWAFAGDAWVWVPGPPAVRPVYAPALVAWVGGPRFGVSLAIGGGGGAVGWFALGPGELWAPAYHASPRYFNQVNVSNTVVNRNVNITNVYNNVYVNKNTTNITYVNQNVNGAVSAVPQNAMVTGRPVAQAALRVPPNAVAAAQIQQAAPVAPQRSAVVGGASPTKVAPPPAVMNRSIVARATPPPPPVPFAQQQAALQQNPGQPLNRTALTQIQRTQLTQPGQSGAPQGRPMYRQAQVNQAPPNPSAPLNRPNRPQNVQAQPGLVPPPSAPASPTPANGPVPAERPAVTQTNQPGNTAPSAPLNRPNHPPNAQAQPGVIPPTPAPPLRNESVTRPAPVERPIPAEHQAPPNHVNSRPPGNPQPPKEKSSEHSKKQDQKRENKRDEK